MAPGDTLPITLNGIHQPGSGNIDYFYYMVNRIVSYQQFLLEIIQPGTFTYIRENQGGPAKGKCDDWCSGTPDPPRQAEEAELVQFGEELKSELIAI